MTAREVCIAWGENMPGRSVMDTRQTQEEIGVLYDAYEGVREVLTDCPDPGW